MGKILKVNEVIGKRGFIAKTGKHRKCLKNKVD